MPRVRRTPPPVAPAVTGPPANAARLPIRVVLPSDSDYERKEGGGGEREPFVPVTPELRRRLADQVDAVARSLPRPSGGGAIPIPGVARVSLRPEAVAKTHRPDTLFNDRTCPIIGGGRLGELHVSADSAGLARIANRIRSGNTRVAERHISTLLAVEPYTAANALAGFPNRPLPNAATGVVDRIRVELFRHAADEANRHIDQAFDRLARVNRVGQVREVVYAPGTRFLSLGQVPAAAVQAIAAFPGTKSVAEMPRYYMSEAVASYRRIRAADRRLFPPPRPGAVYPVVGVVDGDTHHDDPILGPWVVGRHSIVAPELADYEHGTFVSGLVVGGHLLNHRDKRFPDAMCQVVNVSVFERNDEGVSSVSEDNLLDALREAIRKFPQVKTWVLALGTNVPCRPQEVSPFAQALDHLQRLHDIQLVIAAGNTAPDVLRPWPPNGEPSDRDAVCPPTDSVHALTVGGVAHRATALAAENDPAPYTRRGPGPLFSMTPQLAYPGGNCHPDGSCDQAGVRSLGVGGHIVEAVGTSFAAPQAAVAVAHVLSELSPHGLPVMTAKAMMVHAAQVAGLWTAGPTLNYLGVGQPPVLPDVTSCSQGAPTLALRVPMFPGMNFVKDPFPMPDCLFDPDSGMLQADVLATLYYLPPTLPGGGIEYCRTNVQLSLGTVASGGAVGTEVFKGRLTPFPARSEAALERRMIENGVKWNPLKLSRKRCNLLGHRHWRLRMEFLQRGSPLADGEVQECLLLLTIRSLVANREVYDELVREMTKLGWVHAELLLRDQSRLGS